MKIAYEKMSTVIEILPDKVASLVVESAQALYQLLMELKGVPVKLLFQRMRNHLQ